MSTSNPRNMGRDHVVDTGALISWPIDRLIGSIASPNQQQELIKISPDRVEIINAIEILWRNPSQEAINKIIDIGRNTGDISGLSPVDIDIMALAYEKKCTLITDDYRMQNLAEHIGINWNSIDTEGIKEVWNWELVCTGCKKIQLTPMVPLNNKKDQKKCIDCGSDVKLRKKR